MTELANKTPIIFIHYGYSEYMKYTLKAAVRNNPDKDIILLGDQANSHCTQFGVVHIPFKKFEYGEELNEFNKSFKLISGEKFEEKTAGEPWTKFNFKKWIYLYNFVRENKPESLWTFDTDTILLESLSPLEDHYAQYDYTSYNNNNQLQGLINNFSVLKDFIHFTNSLFDDKDFIQKQLRDFKQNPDYGFTLMRSFKTFHEKGMSSTVRLIEPVDDKMFDEVMCAGHGMVTHKKTINGYTPKKLFFHNNGSIYVKQKDESGGRYFKLWGINLSWVPLHIFRRVYKQNKTNGSDSDEIHADDLTVMDLEPDFQTRLGNKLYVVKKFIRELTS